tara:strand:+ start:3408 stop:4334 length:927 start_codon:yes stop_codon:yes gene_type:complete
MPLDVEDEVLDGTIEGGLEIEVYEEEVFSDEESDIDNVVIEDEVINPPSCYDEDTLENFCNCLKWGNTPNYQVIIAVNDKFGIAEEGTYSFDVGCVTNYNENPPDFGGGLHECLIFTPNEVFDDSLEPNEDPIYDGEVDGGEDMEDDSASSTSERWYGMGAETLFGSESWVSIDKDFYEVGGDIYDVGFKYLPLGVLNGRVFFEIDYQSIESGTDGGSRAMGIWSINNVEFDTLQELVESEGLEMPIGGIGKNLWSISDEPYVVATTTNPDLDLDAEPTWWEENSTLVYVAGLSLLGIIGLYSAFKRK